MRPRYVATLALATLWLLGDPFLACCWQGLAILQRVENEGMDIAAHNVTLEWARFTGSYKKYKHFIFLNSSVRGPFYPTYMPLGWQWTMAFTSRLTETTKVGPSLGSSGDCTGPPSVPS